MVDRRPAVIALCAGTADVVTAVRAGRELDLEIGVRCGGHSVLGLSVPDGGLMIGLSLMGTVRVDPRRLRLIFERAQGLGMIDADADLEVAITLCTGSWYARALAGAAPPANWPQRTAALGWRAVGGTAPPGR